MSDTLLNIAGIDLTEYICSGGLKTDESPVYDDAVTFTAVSGKEHRKMIGISVSLKIVLTDVPTSAAKSIVTACDNDELDVTYAAPLMRNGKFRRPDISSDISYEADNTRYYTISMSMTCPFIALEGL